MGSISDARIGAGDRSITLREGPPCSPGRHRGSKTQSKPETTWNNTGTPKAHSQPVPSFRGAPRTNTLLNITFSTILSVADKTASIAFSDVPTLEKVADSVGNELASTFIPGLLVIKGADFEGDLSPAPNGNKQVDIFDWIQVGRYVAGLDDIGDTSQFQRADSAPLETSGNGLLTVSDWVQAGRFAVGLDPLVPVGGPTHPVVIVPGRTQPKPQAGNGRIISVAAQPLLFGRTNQVSVSLAAQGDENAVAFSLNYDPAHLTFLSASVGSQVPGAAFNVNTRHAAVGRLGFAVALSSGKQLGMGAREIANLRFVVANPGENISDLSFGDAPVIREVASAQAQTLPSAWQNTALSVTVPIVSVVRIQTTEGPGVNLSWSARFTGGQLEFATEPNAHIWTKVPIDPVLAGGVNSVSVPLDETNKYFRLYLP